MTLEEKALTVAEHLVEKAQEILAKAHAELDALLADKPIEQPPETAGT